MGSLYLILLHILHDIGRRVVITLGDCLIITPDPGQEAGREGGGGGPGVPGVGSMADHWLGFQASLAVVAKARGRPGIL